MEFESYKYNVIEIAKNAFDDVMKNKSDEINNSRPLMIEFARHGENYFNDNKVKLMIVGRASGTTKKPHLTVTKYDTGKCTISEKKIADCFEEYYYEDLGWIHKKGDNRYVDSKPFFGFSKKVYLDLVGVTDEPEWYKNICYTNLCKIISSEVGGNPSEKLKSIQLENGMLELLKTEIDYYKPTHILVLDSATEEHSWSSNELKDAIKKHVINHNPKIKICFSDRPEFRGYEALKEKVLIEFGKE